MTAIPPMKLITALLILTGENSPLEHLPHEMAICRQRLAQLQKETNQPGLMLIKLRDRAKRKKK